MVTCEQCKREITDVDQACHLRINTTNGQQETFPFCHSRCRRDWADLQGQWEAVAAEAENRGEQGA